MGYFHVKTVHGKIFFWVSDENLTMNYYKGQTFCSIADELNALLYITKHSFNVHFAQVQVHNDNPVQL